MTTRGRAPSPHDPPIDVDDPVDVLTNLPAMLGHYPCESLVLVIRDGAEDPGPILVREIPGDDVPDADAVEELREAILVAAEQMADEGFSAADVYVVSRRWAGGGPGGAPWHAIVTGALDDGGLDPGAIAGARALRAGETVTEFDGEVLGVIGEPTDCRAARRLFDAGEHIAADAAELRDRFRPEAPGMRIAAGDALRRANGDVRGARRAGGPPAGAELDDVRRHHVAWLMLVDAVDRGDVSLDDALSEPAHLRVLARPLVSLLLRDMTMSAVLDDCEPTVRALWLGCARLFRGTARANALACYAVDRQMHGSAVVARAALEAALETDPGHSLSKLLGAAFSTGRSDIALRSMLEATVAMIGEIHPDDGAVA